jgi:hypothetical protein
VDDRENRDVPIIDFVDTGHLAPVSDRDIGARRSKRMGCVIDASRAIFCRTESTSMTSNRQSPNSATNPNKGPKLSRTHAPSELSVVEWQRRLRRQFGREQAFGLENLGSDPFFSEFRVAARASTCSMRRPGKHGPAVEPGRSRTAHRTYSSHRPGPAGASH